MLNDYSQSSPSRKKAKSLNAQDAEVLIISTLANVRSCLSQKQMNQIQKVLDAAVVNPAVKKEAEELNRRAVTHRAGNLVIRDERIDRRIDKVTEGMIWVHEQDKHIRLDYEKLLVANALDPITDNPDEAAYLKKVRNTLDDKGVWLRVAQERSSDPRSFVVWLSLGYDGDEIPAGIGILDREAIFGNQLLGANYHNEVWEGNFRKTIESEIYRLGLEIEDGQKEHRRLIARYDKTYEGLGGVPVPGVPEISDALGGADLPGISIWKNPEKALSAARDSFYADKFERAEAYLVLGAVATNKAGQILQNYSERSTEGAALGALIAQITAVSCGVILTIYDVTSITRGLALEEAAAAIAARQAAKDAQYAAMVKDATGGGPFQLILPRGGQGNVVRHGSGRARGR